MSKERKEGIQKWEKYKPLFFLKAKLNKQQIEYLEMNLNH